MKTFLKVKTVGSGMTRLLNDFCILHDLESPVSREYAIDEQITFGKWLKKLKYLDRQYRKESIGLEIGALINPTHIGISAYLANSCTKLSDFLELSAKYTKLWYNYMPKKISFNEKQFIVSWDKPAYLEAGLYTRETAISEEIQVSIFYHRLKQLVGDYSQIIDSIELATPRPSQTDIYEKMFNCPVKFDTEQTRIFLPREILDIPIAHSDPFLFQILCKEADRILAEMPKEDSFAEIVNNTIIRALQDNHAHIEYVARSLNISARVLQKNLKEKDLSFQEMLNEIRFNLAIKFLQDENLSIADISFLLAYRDQTSFNRAFKNWTGMAPSQWRKSKVPISKNNLCLT